MITLAAGATTAILSQKDGGTSSAGSSTKATPVQATGDGARVRGVQAKVTVWVAVLVAGLMIWV